MDQDVRKISDSVFVTGDYVFLMDYPDKKMHVIRIEESTIEEYKTAVDQKCAAECRLKECLQRILKGSWGEPKSTEELIFANDLARWSYKYELCRLSLDILDLNNKLVKRLQGDNINDNPLPTSEQIVEDLSKTLSEYNKILNASNKYDTVTISNALRHVCDNEIMNATYKLYIMNGVDSVSSDDCDNTVEA